MRKSVEEKFRLKKEEALDLFKRTKKSEELEKYLKVKQQEMSQIVGEYILSSEETSENFSGANTEMILKLKYFEYYFQKNKEIYGKLQDCEDQLSKKLKLSQQSNSEISIKISSLFGKKPISGISQTSSYWVDASRHRSRSLFNIFDENSIMQPEKMQSPRPLIKNANDYLVKGSKNRNKTRINDD